MAGYLTLCYDGIDSDYSKIFVDLLDRQDKTKSKANKLNNKKISIDNFMTIINFTSIRQ